MFLGCLSKAARIHNYDYDCSFSLGIVITFVVVFTVIVVAAAAAAAASAINMVYGCCYNPACVTGTIMTAFMIFDNFTVTITTVPMLLVLPLSAISSPLLFIKRAGRRFPKLF